MKKGCVSVIIPVYNQEKYIQRCVNSVLNQSYMNLEIIVVDDGSTDQTPQILENMSKKDDRIKVYHTENGGVSKARNYGIDKVCGEYIQFLDADDFIKKDMTKTMVDEIGRRNVDMVICNYIKFFDRVKIYNEILDRLRQYSSSEYLINILKNPGHHYYGVVWNKLYKTQIVKNNKLYFSDDVTLGEDFIFNIKYWEKSKDVFVLRRYFYYYNKTGNVTLSHKKCKKIADCISELNNRKKIFKVYEEAVNKIDNSENIKIELYKYWVVFYVRHMYGMGHEYKEWNIKEKDEWCEIILSEAYVRQALLIVPQKWIQGYAKGYRLEYLIKDMIKKLLYI